MFLRSIAYLPVQRTFFQANRLPNVQVQRKASSEHVDKDKPCKDPCVDNPPQCTSRIKKLQSKFQSMEACPIWSMSGPDKMLYTITLGLAVAGFALSAYNILIKI